MRDDPAAKGAAEAVIAALRAEMCEVGRRIWQRGLCAGCEGNLSVRVSADRVLCTPSGVSKGFLEPHMLRIVTLDGAAGDDAAGFAVTSEIRVHLAVYRTRPYVRAVVHSHPPHANAFALAGVPLPEGIYPEAEIVLGRVPVVRYALPGTPELADRVALSLTAHTTAMLLAHHGALTLSGRGLVDAYHRLEVLDSYCHILLGVARLGTVEVLDGREMDEVLASKRRQHGMGDDRFRAGALDARNRVAFGAMGVEVRPRGARPARTPAKTPAPA